VRISFTAIFLWAMAFRAIGLWGDPILEDDFYRYLLDGCVFVASGSPYGIPPSSLFFENSLSPHCEQLLNGVNNPDLPTIYAPLLQYIFAIAHIISPANIDALQAIYSLIDLALILVLGKCAPARHVMLWKDVMQESERQHDEKCPQGNPGHAHGKLLSSNP